MSFVESTGWRGLFRATTLSLVLVHVAVAVGLLCQGWSWTGLLLAVGVYYLRMVVVTTAYHRYFAHRAFRTSRTFQFLLALAAQSAAQKGVVWWASHHRWHHKHSDTERDVHSAKLHGFWHAHMGWLFAQPFSETDSKLVPDLMKFPELRWLDRSPWHIAPAFALALVFLLIGGGHALLWGFFVSTVMVWHGSFAINSLAHTFGSRPYATADESRNSWWLALLTAGEGWHNNHHRYPGAARQGFLWWQLDPTYYVLRVLAALGLIWDLHPLPSDAGTPVSPRLPAARTATGTEQ